MIYSSFDESVGGESSLLYMADYIAKWLHFVSIALH